MTIRTKILEALKRTDGLCDDCLSEVTSVRPRQAVNAQCRQLATDKIVSRPREECARCRGPKIINRMRLPGMPQTAARPLPSLEPSASNRPWYWEGNVQTKIVQFLQANGHAVQSAADTASREQGKDIVVLTPEQRPLWITVKGFPDKSKNVQARHWFAGALHDLSRYRDEDADALLGMGLPRGFKTYEGLVQRNASVRKFLGYSVYWVGEDGSVVVDRAA